MWYIPKIVVLCTKLFNMHIAPLILWKEIEYQIWSSQACKGFMFPLPCSWCYEWYHKLAEWRSGSVSTLPCERPGFASRTRLREIIPANNCTMQGQNNWGNWGSPGVMNLWVAWEVLRWLMKFRELCNGGFHPKLVTPPYHGFLNVNTPPNSQNSKRH